jgi:amino acid adenylation domain-containing protein
LQARKTPDAIAVTCGGEHLTYRELRRQANQLAHYLKSLGVGTGTPVALLLERSLQMVVAILGVLKAGAVYVPVDLAYPKERFGFMLEDTQAPVLLTQESLRPALPATTAKVVFLDADRDLISSGPATGARLPAVRPNATAYIIYTSGSTGKPKGVLVTHHNVVRLFQATAPWYGFNAADVWTLFHSYSFDVSVWEIWGALFHGGRLVVVPYTVSRSPAQFYELLSREKVTVLSQTPSAFRQLLWAEQAAPAPLPLSLRYVVLAGEALELQSLKPWFDRHGDETPRVINMYGITETTVHATYRVIRQADLARGAGSVIGVPIPDLQILLLDDQLNPVQPGVVGEIWVGGEGVAQGYLNRPELTAERFVSSPFSPGERLYRSGDLAKHTADGELEYLGRKDHQVKIRGFRVELGEIESALNRHPGIRECVVVAQERPEGDKRLVAYFVPANQAPSVTELREHLARGIPDYMIPAVFVPLKSLPLTTNGKVDRRALPEPDGSRPELATEFVAPRDVTEQILAKTWRDVLEVQSVGVNDNYFELGGDSIRSISILAKAHQCGLELSLQELFQHPTIAGLAALARPSDAKAPPSQTQPFSLISAVDRAKLPSGIEDAYPLAQLQLGMFFHNELNPLSAIYHDIFSFRIQSPFDAARLRMAVNRLVARHPVLRTSFHLAGFSEPMQLVHTEIQAPFAVEDVRSLSPDQQHQCLAEWVEAEKRRPFDPTAAPLTRFHVQRYSDSAFQFIVSFHHVCMDGWSLAAALTEIFQEYHALLQAAAGSQPPILPLRVTYRDFVALEQQAVASEESRLFWRQQCRETDMLPLPRWPRSFRAGGQEQTRGPECYVEPRVLDGLRKVAKQAGAPLKSVLLAAHQRVLALLYGRSEIVSGVVFNGRPVEVDGEKLLGLFLNTLPFRLRLEGGSWLDLVRQTFAAEQQIIPHRRFPLSEIQTLHGGLPLFEAAFDFVQFHVYNQLQGCHGLDLAEGHYFEANNLTAFTNFLLDASGTRLELHIDYDPNELCRPQIEEISGYYLRALEAMAADPLSRYEQFSPLSDPERHRLLIEWNSAALDYPRNQCLHQLFEAQAARTPDAVALVAGDQRVTYGELDRRANQLAGRLAELQVGPDVLVGICLERSVDLVAGLLGILKAGGAYVPLDPAYPRDRLAFMLEDSQARVIMTQRDLRGLFSGSSSQVLLIDAESTTGVRNSDFAPSDQTRNAERVPCAPVDRAQPPQPANLAYVLYTSGSTGQPKGVAIEHRSAVALVSWARGRYSPEELDGVLASTSICFDLSVFELFVPLCHGGKVILIENALALPSLPAASEIRLINTVPSLMRELLRSHAVPPSVRVVNLAGEPLSAQLVDRIYNETSAQNVYDLYGPTEATTYSTCALRAKGDPATIGRPLPGTQIYLLDARLQPVPVGVAGELYIGGAGLARGYLHRPELTAARFIQHPFLPGSRLYRTGDLARWRPDGQLEFLGRSDHQVKLRGLRIELGEVEVVLKQHPAISEAVAQVREGEGGDQCLAAYVVLHLGKTVPDAEIRAFLEKRLPTFMVPSCLVPLQKLPLTPSGKVDRQALPAPAGLSGLAPATHVAPRNPTETLIADTWQRILGCRLVGIHDNFFQLGGHSLLAMRAVAHIADALKVDLTVRTLFRAPTVAELAQALDERRSGEPDRSAPILPRARQGAEAQELLGRLDELSDRQIEQLLDNS